MINRIARQNQVATPSDQMGTPPDIGKSQMGVPPDTDKTNEQIQSDASIAQSLQQNALQKAGDQRVQASLLQTELLRKLANPPEPVADSERLMNSIKDKDLQESGPGDERAIKEAVDVATEGERLMNGIKDRKDLQAKDIEKDVDGFLTADSERLMNSIKDTKAFDPQPEPPVMPDLQNKL